jgi:hypothetical protein
MRSPKDPPPLNRADWELLNQALNAFKNTLLPDRPDPIDQPPL